MEVRPNIGITLLKTPGTMRKQTGRLRKFRSVCGGRVCLGLLVSPFYHGIEDVSSDVTPGIKGFK
jgi:hypothetical protein